MKNKKAEETPKQENKVKQENPMKMRHVFSIIVAVVVLGFLLSSMTMVFENVDAGEIMVVQSPVSGELSWHTTPGVKWQGFGKITSYVRRSQFWFSANHDQGKSNDESLLIRFNDGGHANISGSISWEFPLDSDHLNLIHQKFGGLKALEQQLIRTTVEKAIYMTGPLMSSTDSYASRRNELLHLIEDQISNGIYQTKITSQIQKDPLTGLESKTNVVHLILDKEGKPLRNEDSPLQEFKIRAFNLAINGIKYEGKVEAQIQQQQEATMAISIAIAEAKRAEQQVLTTIKEGEATAAKAEWMQKAISVKQTTEANMRKEIAETEGKQKLEVARLDAEAAKQFKLAEIERGQGEATRRKLILDADGALEKKLDAWKEVQKAYATAIGEYKGNWVSSIVMGQNAQHANGAQTLIDLLMAKTAKDLSLDLSVHDKVSKIEKK